MNSRCEGFVSRQGSGKPEPLGKPGQIGKPGPQSKLEPCKLELQHCTMECLPS